VGGRPVRRFSVGGGFFRRLGPLRGTGGFWDCARGVACRLAAGPVKGPRCRADGRYLRPYRMLANSVRGPDTGPAAVVGWTRMLGAVISPQSYAAIRLVNGYGDRVVTPWVHQRLFAVAVTFDEGTSGWKSEPAEQERGGEGSLRRRGFVQRSHRASGTFAWPSVGRPWWCVGEPRPATAAGRGHRRGMGSARRAVLGRLLYGGRHYGLDVLAVSPAGRPGAFAVDGTPPRPNRADHGSGRRRGRTCRSDGSRVPGRFEALSRASRSAEAGLSSLPARQPRVATKGKKKTRLPGAFLDIG